MCDGSFFHQSFEKAAFSSVVWQTSGMYRGTYLPVSQPKAQSTLQHLGLCLVQRVFDTLAWASDTHLKWKSSSSWYFGQVTLMMRPCSCSVSKIREANTEVFRYARNDGQSSVDVIHCKLACDECIPPMVLCLLESRQTNSFEH